MPTIITHAVVGLALGRLYTARRMPRVWYWDVLVILAILPDIDVLAFRFDIPYEAMLGHRGFTHSIPFAWVIGGLAAAICYRHCQTRFWDLWGLFFVTVASHGLLDACTYGGGEGVGFLAPFDGERFWSPWRPIQVSQMGLHFFKTTRALETLWSEFVWVCLPAGLVVGVVELVRWTFSREPKASAADGDERSPPARD